MRSMHIELRHKLLDEAKGPKAPDEIIIDNGYRRLRLQLVSKNDLVFLKVTPVGGEGAVSDGGIFANKSPTTDTPQINEAFYLW